MQNNPLINKEKEEKEEELWLQNRSTCYKTWQKSECREVRGRGRQWLCKMNVPFTADDHLSRLRLITQKNKRIILPPDNVIE